MANEVDYRDSTPNNFPQDYDPAKVDPRVKLRSESIKHKQKGKHTREAMYQSLEIGATIASEAKTTALDTESRQNAVDQSQKDFEDRYNEQIAGNTDLDETIDLRGDSAGNIFKTAKERVDNIEKTFDYQPQIELAENVDLSIKNDLLQYKTSVNQSAVKLLLIQDLHYSKRSNMNDAYDQAAPRTLDHLKAMELIADDLDGAIINGDSSHGNELKGITIIRNKQIVATAKGVLGDTPLLMTVGNHDDNTVFLKTTDERLDLAELEAIYGKTYSYHDYEDKKLRVILLSGFENPEIYGDDGLTKYPRGGASVFTQEQLKWLANDALIVPSGYHVIIFNHSPLQGFFGNLPYPTMNCVNHDVLINILMAFINGSTMMLSGGNTDFPINMNVDFSKQGKGTLVG
ncbi:MAG: metallophosphoesterase, partial [Bacillota bacterium]|nr:metallophosphoesterase [Bacillota bacterium]